MSIWHHPHNLTLVKKPTVQLQNTSVYILAYSGNVRNLSWFFFQALSAVLCCTLLPPVFLSPSPASCVIKPD